MRAPTNLVHEPGCPRDLPALMRAQKAQGKAAKVGFDWPPVAEVQAKVREEVAEVEAETTHGPRP